MTLFESQCLLKFDAAGGILFRSWSFKLCSSSIWSAGFCRHVNYWLNIRYFIFLLCFILLPTGITSSFFADCIPLVLWNLARCFLQSSHRLSRVRANCLHEQLEGCVLPFLTHKDTQSEGYSCHSLSRLLFPVPLRANIHVYACMLAFKIWWNH